MWKRQSSYRSFHDYELDRVLEQKKNLAQVESVLTMYERNNLDLVQTVEELIRENKILKRDRRHDSHIREQQNYPNFGIKHSNISIKQSKYIQTQPQSHKSSTKQAAHLPNCNSTYHPRNAYLTPQQIQSLSNRRKYNEAKMAQTSYNHSRQYEQFKQKLSNKKEQLKRSYKSKSNLQTSNYNMSMSRKVYLEQPSLETQQKLPLQENNMCVNNNGSKDQTIKDKGNLNTKNKESLSPYENFKTNSSYNSPFQKHKTRNDNKALVERSSSAIKIEDVYSQNSVRIQQPKTKWKDVSSTYFSKQKRNYNMEKGDKDQQNRQEINENSSFSARLYKTTTTMVKEDQGGKKSRRKFLKVVSGNPAAAQKSFQ